MRGKACLSDLGGIGVVNEHSRVANISAHHKHAAPQHSFHHVPATSAAPLGSMRVLRVGTGWLGRGGERVGTSGDAEADGRTHVKERCASVADPSVRKGFSRAVLGAICLHCQLLRFYVRKSQLFYTPRLKGGCEYIPGRKS